MNQAVQELADVATSLQLDYENNELGGESCFIELMEADDDTVHVYQLAQTTRKFNGQKTVRYGNIVYRGIQVKRSKVKSEFENGLRIFTFNSKRSIVILLVNPFFDPSTSGGLVSHLSRSERHNMYQIRG
uniref:Myosin motor domain-containing protein n=1 Tax=Caenorhabditis tropicalis TaxID=1561998 RepID=A0A1I7TKY2_9PELO